MAREDNAAVQRVLLLILILAPLRRGETLVTLIREVSDRTGRKWSDRTIRRDLHLLQRCRLVERHGEGELSRWYWRGVGNLAKAFEK